MAFVREVIPEEYWGMLKELGVFSDRLRRKLWIADKDRGIYLWVSRGADREDRTTDYILIWQGQIIDINSMPIEYSKQPTWNENHTEVLKGLIKDYVNYIKIPTFLVGQEEELIQIIKEVFQNLDYHYDIILERIPKPEVREDK
ncbi:hypothetical protein [Streptococcus dentiloxodontae]